MSVTKCPSNCDHDYLFQHSIIDNTHREVIAGVPMVVSSSFVVCRECNHWIDGVAVAKTCRCPFHCHEEAGGTIIVHTAADQVRCS